MVRTEHDELWRALATLPQRQRAVLVLRAFEALPDERIAELMGTGQATVRSLANLGVAALRRAGRPAPVLERLAAPA